MIQPPPSRYSVACRRVHEGACASTSRCHVSVSHVLYFHLLALCHAIIVPGVRPDCADPGVRPALLVHGGHPKVCVEREEAAGVQLEERQAMPQRPWLRREAATAAEIPQLHGQRCTGQGHWRSDVGRVRREGFAVLDPDWGPACGDECQEQGGRRVLGDQWLQWHRGRHRLRLQGAAKGTPPVFRLLQYGMARIHHCRLLLAAPDRVGLDALGSLSV